MQVRDIHLQLSLTSNLSKTNETSVPVVKTHLDNIHRMYERNSDNCRTTSHTDLLNQRWCCDSSWGGGHEVGLGSVEAHGCIVVVTMSESFEIMARDIAQMVSWKGGMWSPSW